MRFTLRSTSLAAALALAVLDTAIICREAHAQYVAYKGAVWAVPCGGPCYSSLKFISIDRYEPNVVRSLMQVVESYDGSGLGKRVWWFAACNQGRFARGFSSDGSDAVWDSVILEDGTLVDGGAGANLYSRYEAMCKY